MLRRLSALVAALSVLASVNIAAPTPVAAAYYGSCGTQYSSGFHMNRIYRDTAAPYNFASSQTWLRPVHACTGGSGKSMVLLANIDSPHYVVQFGYGDLGDGNITWIWTPGDQTGGTMVQATWATYLFGNPNYYWGNKFQFSIERVWNGSAYVWRYTLTKVGGSSIHQDTAYSWDRLGETRRSVWWAFEVANWQDMTGYVTGTPAIIDTLRYRFDAGGSSTYIPTGDRTCNWQPDGRIYSPWWQHGACAIDAGSNDYLQDYTDNH